MITSSKMIRQNGMHVSIIMVIALGWFSMPCAQIARAQADSAYNAWYAKYWNSSNNTFYKRDNQSGRIDFWRYAHDWQIMMDRYELTRDTMYFRQMKQAWTGFHNTNGMGTNWRENDFNDDIQWWVIAACRAYTLTRDTVYRHVAKREFDWMYSTQWDMTLGGGIWWKNTDHGGKMACSNGPAAVGAMYLYDIYNDTAYLSKAKAIYQWERGALYNENTGAVADHMNSNGSVSGGPLFYNQGTFFGSAFRLFQATGDSSYYRDAIKTIDYVRNNMSNRTTGILNNGGYTGDGCTFLLIFIHHMMYCIIEGKQTQYLDWMTLNAETAWKNRRKSDNIMSSNFGSVPPSSGLESSSSSGGVAVLTLAVLANQPTAISMPGECVRPMAVIRPPKEMCTYSLLGERIPTNNNRVPSILLHQMQNGTVIKKVQLR